VAPELEEDVDGGLAARLQPQIEHHSAPGSDERSRGRSFCLTPAEAVAVIDEQGVGAGLVHRVKSGITGWAQVHGLRGQTSLAERIEWDNSYIAHWSLGLDLKIPALTPAALFRNAE
jgi:hypothetical protein